MEVTDETAKTLSETLKAYEEKYPRAQAPKLIPLIYLKKDQLRYTQYLVVIQRAFG